MRPISVWHGGVSICLMVRPIKQEKKIGNVWLLSASSNQFLVNITYMFTRFYVFQEFSAETLMIYISYMLN